MNIYPLLSALIICIAANLIAGTQIIYIVFNSLILLVSFFYFKINNKESTNYIPVLAFISLGIIPLLTFQPFSILASILVLTSLILLVLPIPIKVKGFLVLISLLLYLFAGLLINQIIVINGFAFSLNKDGIIFLDESIPTLVNKLRTEFKVNLIISSLIYNKLSLYTYFFFSNLGNFFTLRAFYDTLTLANLYPLFFGIIYYFKNITKTTKIPLLLFIIFLISLGLNKHPDKFSSLYIAAPVLIYFILLGIGRVNLRLYFTLFIISLFLLFAPKV